MVEEQEILTEERVRQIMEKDYSTVLVFKQTRNNITGFIKVKEFALKYILSELEMQAH